MNIYRKIVLVLIFGVVLFGNNLFAQTGNADFSKDEWRQIESLKKKFLPYFGYISFSNVIAQDKFMDALLEQQLGAAAPGFAFGGGVFIGEQIPIAFGLDVSFNFLASDTKYSGSLFYRDTITTSASFIPFSVFMRVQPDLIYLQPYIEGFVGFTPITTTIEYKIGGYGGNYNNSVNDGAFPFHWGFGAGLAIPFFTKIAIPDEKVQMLFDVNFRMIKGAKADFKVYKLVGDNYTETTVVTDATDMIMMKAGLTVRF